MVTSWITIGKASGTTWVKPANTQGTQVYDEATITYDSAISYYDSTNSSVWSIAAKASGTAWTTIAKAT